jgi:hypothetical protein
MVQSNLAGIDRPSACRRKFGICHAGLHGICDVAEDSDGASDYSCVELAERANDGELL